MTRYGGIVDVVDYEDRRRHQESAKKFRGLGRSKKQVEKQPVDATPNSSVTYWNVNDDVDVQEGVALGHGCDAPVRAELHSGIESLLARPI